MYWERQVGKPRLPSQNAFTKVIIIVPEYKKTGPFRDRFIISGNKPDRSIAL